MPQQPDPNKTISIMAAKSPEDVQAGDLIVKGATLESFKMDSDSINIVAKLNQVEASE